MWEHRHKILEQAKSMRYTKWRVKYGHDFVSGINCATCGVPFSNKHTQDENPPTMDDVCPAKTKNYTPLEPLPIEDEKPKRSKRYVRTKKE